MMNYPNTKFLAMFSLDPFWGDICPITSKQALFNKVDDRVYLLGHLEDDKGNLRSIDSISEDELVAILREVTQRDVVHLVDSFAELKALSTDPKFRQLIEQLNNK